MSAKLLAFIAESDEAAPRSSTGGRIDRVASDEGARPNAAVAIATLALAGLAMVSPLYGVIPAVRAIADDLGVAQGRVAWIGFTFGFAYAVACLIFGPLSDLTGRRRILVVGLACSALAAAAVALSPNVTVLYVTRGVAGFCAGTFGPVALGWVTERYSGQTRSTAVAVVGAGLIGAGTVGQLLVSALLPYGWRAPFWLFAALDALFAVLVAIVVHDVDRPRAEHSLAEVYADELRLLRKPRIPATYALGFVLYGGFVTFYAGLGPYLSAHGVTGGEVLAVRALGLPGMVLSIFAGRFMASRGPRVVVLRGVWVLVAALALCSAGSAEPSVVIATSAIYVLGFAFAAVALNGLVARLAGPVRGSAIAFLVFVAFTGASIAVPLVAAFAGTPFSLLAGALALVSAVVGLLVASLVPPESRAEPVPPAT